MIELTRLNGNRLAVNSDLILFAESAPDTLLTMVTGEKLIVSENLEELAERMAACRARTLAEASRLCPGGVMFTSGSVVSAFASACAANSTRSENDIDAECTNMMRRRRRADL